MVTLEENEFDSLCEDKKTLFHQLWMGHAQFTQLLEQDEQAVSYITEYLTAKKPKGTGFLASLRYLVEQHHELYVCAKTWKVSKVAVKIVEA